MRRQKRNSESAHRKCRESWLYFIGPFPATDQHSHLLVKGIPASHNCWCATVVSVLAILAYTDSISGVALGCSIQACCADQQLKGIAMWSGTWPFLCSGQTGKGYLETLILIACFQATKVTLCSLVCAQHGNIDLVMSRILHKSR